MLSRRTQKGVRKVENDKPVPLTFDLSTPNQYTLTDCRGLNTLQYSDCHIRTTIYVIDVANESEQKAPLTLSLSLSLSLSLHFNGHFPGEPRLACVY